MSPPDAPTSLRMMAPLSDEEIDALDRFLLSDTVSDEGMTLDTLDGYLTAIIVGPTTLMPSRWLPHVWGSEKDDAPEFESLEQAQRILDLIMRHMNGIVWSLRHDPDAFEPIFSERRYRGRDYVDGEMWAHGFMDGIALNRADWQPLFDDSAASRALRPLHLLGSDEVSAAEEALTKTPAQRESLTKRIPAGVAAIYRFWLPYREAIHQRTLATTTERSQPKVGRNDPCLCGSGKKFKKCCGAAGSSR